jgi:predicted ATPase/DNA-binding winged helix-turn-helix (wHTH) protein
MIMSAAQARDAISFGPFSLVASERLLTKEGVPVELGARALDILIALVSRPNEVVSKKDLLARVWPDVTVEESSLRVHIANLRKARGDGTDGARYITTLAGRGYCFVAPISQSSDRSNASSAAVGHFPHANLPSPLLRIVGRSDDILRLSTQLTAARFVTIVGAGGIGKTTVAVAVGRCLSEAFADAVLFVDLGMLSDPRLVTTSIAAMLGLSVRSDDTTPSLIAYLRDKRILLILDTCEHLVDAVAGLASHIVAAAPQVHILATSREALQVEGEHVYKLDPLICPPDDPGLTAAVAQTFPAIQLFMDRAVSSGARLDFNDAETGIVVGICRKLDGVALAIELAARRVEAYGLAQTAALLDQRLTLLWLGPRTAPPRQKTLRATLDWSYGLLSEPERIVLRRLAVFVGHFTLDAALAVATSAGVDQSLVFSAFDSLVAKSMVATHPIGAMMRYRLLDTTRAYVLETNIDDAELGDLRMRHAAYYRQWLEQTGTDWPTLSSGAERAPYFAALNNVRAALEWCFGTHGNVEVGVKLASAAAPVFLAMSLLSECHRWSERAVLALDDTTLGGLDEMHLQTALGLSLNFIRGEIDAARVALNRGFAIAEERGNALDQVRLLTQLQMLNIRSGDLKTARHYGMRCSVVARTTEDADAVALTHFFLGSVFHFMGDFGDARLELEAALEHERSSRSSTMIYFGFDGRNLTGAILARNLWLQGYPTQAAKRARQTIEFAARMDHSLTLCMALVLCINVFFWNGDLETAEEHINWLISRSEAYFLAPYLAAGRAFKGALAIRRGDARVGVEILKDYLAHNPRYLLLSVALLEGLAAINCFAEGIAAVDETIRVVEASGDLAFMPELLRVKGSLLLSMPQPSVDDAQRYFKRSLELGHSQGARAWELRTATDLAKLWASQGRTDDAKALLQPVFEQFVEGLDTPDLKAAERLLKTLS